MEFIFYRKCADLGGVTEANKAVNQEAINTCSCSLRNDTLVFKVVII
jgi:hypothetical protein